MTIKLIYQIYFSTYRAHMWHRYPSEIKFPAKSKLLDPFKETCSFKNKLKILTTNCFCY